MSDDLLDRLEHYGRTTAMPGSLNDDLYALVARVRGAVEVLNRPLPENVEPLTVEMLRAINDRDMEALAILTGEKKP